jgi:hypothetical protein
MHPIPGELAARASTVSLGGSTQPDISLSLSLSLSLSQIDACNLSVCLYVFVCVCVCVEKPQSFCGLSLVDGHVSSLSAH